MVAFDAIEETKAAEAEYQPFEFCGVDGELYSLPHPMMLDNEQLKRVNALEDGDEEGVFDFMSEFYPEAYAAIQEMMPTVQIRLFNAWNDTVGDLDDEGKGPSQSLGPNRAARRSKQTSRSGASTSGRSGSTKSKAASKR